MNDSLRTVVTKCLTYAERSAKTYGEKVTNEKIDVWLELVESKKLTAVEFLESFMYMIDGEEDFPAWATFWKAHCKHRGSSLRDPVIVGDHDGVLELGERAACDAIGTSYRELGAREGPQALPMTTAGRIALKERLSHALAEAESKLLGKPKPRVRAEYVEDDDPDQKAKHNERMQAIEAEQAHIEEARNEA